jgi:hypothetical protein
MALSTTTADGRTVVDVDALLKRKDVREMYAQIGGFVEASQRRAPTYHKDIYALAFETMQRLHR